MNVGRIGEITKVFIEEGFAAETSGTGDSSGGRTDAEKARRLRRAFERLGPTFVKFGQLLATRIDLFSAEFVGELEQLRAHVPAFPAEEAQLIVERELRRPLADAFVHFESEPVASASIAQVHRAVLKDGTRVAVKVQRPNLAASLLADLDVLVQVSKWLDGLVPAYHRTLVHRVAEEYASRARNEIDFLLEAKAMDRFRALLAGGPERLPLRVPAVHFGLTTSCLLVMDWLEGTLLDDVTSAEHLATLGFDPHAFASALLRLQLRMSYEHGLIHGDTHPGNIILCRDGHIGLIDFGLHGQVGRELRDQMLELLLHQTAGRTDAALQSFATVFEPSPDTDHAAFETELREVLRPPVSPSARDARLTQQLIDGMRVGAKYQLKVRSELLLVLRNLTIVEGIVVRYAPEMNISREVETILSGILHRRLALNELGRDLDQFMPVWLLTLAQRPLLTDKLLRLERVFTESKNLGEFLRREGVIEERSTEKRTDWAAAGIFLVLGALLGALLMWVVSR